MSEPLILELKSQDMLEADRAFAAATDAILAEPRALVLQLHAEVSSDRRTGGAMIQWLERSASRDERFDYFYHAEEISSLASAVRHAGNRAESCYIVFHNYPKGQAFANALQLQFALTERRIRLPENLRRRFPMLEAIAAGAHSNQLEMF